MDVSGFASPCCIFVASIQAVEAGPLQGEKPLADKGDAAINPMPIGTSELVEKSAIAPPESATLWPRRRVA